MADSHKIVSALHATWWLNAVGLLLSYAASVVLVRAMAVGLYAEYGAVLAIVGLGTLIFEAGANSGLTRYLTEAGQLQARGTFYLRMQKRRWLVAVACAVVLIAFGPVYARHTQFVSLAAKPWVFSLIAVIVAAMLTRLLAHYGLLALFENKAALLLQQGFQVVRSVALAAIALAGGNLLALVATLVVLGCVEALVVHHRLWRIIGHERAALPATFINRAQGFGLLTIFDKSCAMLGGGTVLLLVLAPNHPATEIALLTLAIDLVGKLVSLTVMPMGNLVAPYLSQTSDDAAAQALAVGRVLKLSSLLYCFSVGFGVLVLPTFIHLMYGARYDGAGMLALVLLVPTAFENWVRGSCSPALLRNGRYRALATVNVIQAIATISALALAYRQPIWVVIAAVGTVRSVVAAFNLVSVRQLVPAHAYRVPALGLLVAAVSCAVAWYLPVALGAVVFAAGFYAGMRWVVLRDEDTLRIVHRMTGTRLKFVSRLLPALNT